MKKYCKWKTSQITATKKMNNPTNKNKVQEQPETKENKSTY